MDDVQIKQEREIPLREEEEDDDDYCEVIDINHDFNFEYNENIKTEQEIKKEPIESYQYAVEGSPESAAKDIENAENADKEDEKVKEGEEAPVWGEESDENAYERILNMITQISRESLLDFKKFLVEKESKPVSYFGDNPFIKKGFDSIYDFLSNQTHLNDQYSTFNSFTDLLMYLKTSEKYKEVFNLNDVILNDTIVMYKKIMNDIIQKQDREKKIRGNKRRNQKRNEKRKMKERQRIIEEQS